MDFDDWQVTEDVFNDLDSLWGRHTEDCFATYYNRKIARYFFRFWNPETSGIDVFMQSWEVEICWLVPPVYLIPRTLAYMYSQGAKGTLVVPLWKSAVFWPLLTNIYCSFIKDLRVFKSFVSSFDARAKSQFYSGFTNYSGICSGFKIEFRSFGVRI